MPAVAAQFGITLPSGFGYDFAGTVDEIGAGTTGFAVGDRVYGGALGRAAADFVAVKTSAEGARFPLSHAGRHQRRGGEHAPGGRHHRRRRPGGDRPAVR